MTLEYKSRFNDTKMILILNEGDKSITTAQAEQNLITIKQILKDSPDLKQMKKENFKLGQTIIAYMNLTNFTNEFFKNTSLTKQMKCLIIGKGIKHNSGKYNGYRQLGYSQIASIVGCHYNTPRNVRTILNNVSNSNIFTIPGFDFISHIVTKICKSSKERTFRPLYKAGLAEGIANKRVNISSKQNSNYDNGLIEIGSEEDTDNSFRTKIID